jgi:glucose-6-phosphate isomerase
LATHSNWAHALPASAVTAEALGLFLDYSKSRITEKPVKQRIRLDEESGLRSRIDAMFRSEKINVTEKRAVPENRQ